MKVVVKPSAAHKAIRDLLQKARVFSDCASGKASVAVERMPHLVCNWRECYLDAWRRITGRTPRTDYQPPWVVEQAYWITFEDLEKKLQRDEFYWANVCAISSECEQLAQLVSSDSASPLAQVSLAGMNGIVSCTHDIMVTAVELLQSFCLRQGLEVEPSVFSTNVHHHRELYECVLCLWHGVPYQNPWSATAMLRQAIEIRVRHALDIIGIVVNGQPRPISFTVILDVLAAEAKGSGVESEVPLYLVKRLYQWASVFVHTGFRQYPWLVGYAIHYLRPLMCGIMQQDGSWSVDNAVRVDSGAKERIYDRIINDAEGRDGVAAGSTRIYSLGLHRPGRFAKHLARKVAEQKDIGKCGQCDRGEDRD